MARLLCIDRGSYLRGARLALTTALIATAGCATEDGRARRARRPSVAEAPLAPPVRWEHAGSLDRLRVVRDRVRSSHLVDEPEARVRVNDAAADYGRSGIVLPPGSLLVVSHEGADGLLHFAMERPPPGAAGSPSGAPPPWEYTVVDAAGWVLERGRIPTCVRCHQEAAADEVFGPAGLARPGGGTPTPPATRPSL